MAFPNEKYQIYFNQSPFMKKESTEPTFIQNQYAPYDQQNMANYSGYQSSRYLNDGLDDPRFHKMALTNNLVQKRPPFSPRNLPYSSTQQFDLYAPETETVNCYKISSDEFSEDEKPLVPISNHSKRIQKEHFRRRIPNNQPSASKNDDFSKTKRNPWQPDEDYQVIELVAKYGQSWALIASLMKDRSGKQIRDRYLNKLKPDINKSEWTVEEDEIVMDLCRKMGHKWSRISTFLPGRTEGQVKNRFYSHIKKRMGKWAPSKKPTYIEVEESSENDEEAQAKENALGLGLRPEENTAKSLQMLNCAGDYKIVNLIEENAGSSKLCASSINIKLNTSDSKGVTYNLVPAKKDPTDVISYVGGKENVSTADELNSPFSQKSEIQLSSTRASSLSQEKEFEETYDKLSSSLKAPVRENKLHGISFSISNGAFTSNAIKNGNETAGAMKNLKEINKLNFSGVQNMINIKIC